MNRILKSCITLGLFSVVAGSAPAAVRHAGLIQGRFGCESNNEPAFVFDLRNNLDANMLDYTVSTDMANFKAGNGGALVNPVSGRSWTWNDRTTYGYQGRFWMEAGVTYTVYSKCDDGACVFFGGENGTKVASPDTTSGYNVTKCESYTPTKTGWVDFYAYTWDWGGGKGPVGDNLWGLAYNTNGVVCTGNLTKGTEPWMIFQDTGDCETLYYELPESWLSVVSHEETETGYSITLNVTLPEDATNCVASILYDRMDFGDHRISDWPNKVSTAVSGGNQTVTIEIPSLGASVAPVIRAVVKGKEANGVDFIEYSTPLALKDTPLVGLALSDVSFTEGTLAADLLSLGGGASSASLELTLWGDEELTQSLKTVVVSENLTTPGTFAYTFDGLTTNTTYWATVKAVNNNGSESSSAPVPFTTLNPEPGSFLYCNLLQTGFSHFSYQTRLTDYGAGSTSAEVTFEVAKTADFADAKVYPIESLTGDLPWDFHGTADALEPGTTYYARAKAVNTWGLVAYTDVFTVTTRALPYIASDISAIVADGGSNLSFTLTDILDGVTGTVTLKVDGQVVQSWDITAGSSTLACPAFVAIETGATKQVVYEIDCQLDGASYPSTVEAAITGGTNIFVAGSLADCTNFFPIVGESVTLPTIQNASGFYYVVNDTVAELLDDGHTVRTLKAGGSAIVYQELDPAGGTNKVISSVPLVIPPVPAGEGKVFLWTEKNNQWRDPANWICINDPASTGVDYPHNVDDVAMIFQRQGKENSKSFTFGNAESEIVLGELYSGSLNCFNVREGQIALAAVNDGGPVTNAMRFAKSDGSIPRLQYCTSKILPNQQTWFTIGRGDSGYWDDNRLLLHLPQGLILDGGYDNAPSNTVRQLFTKFGNVDIVLAEGKELRLTNLNETQVTFNGTTLQFTSGCTISGGGRIVHETPTYVGMWADLSNFNGTYVEATYHPKTSFDRSFGTFLWSTNVANAALEIAGWVDESLFALVNNNSGAGANLFRGFAGRGNLHGYGSTGTNPGNVLGYTNVVLSGGYLCLWAEANPNWVDRQIVNRPSEMTVERGLSLIYLREQTNENNPTNSLVVPKLTQHNGAVLYLAENNSRSYGMTPEEVRQHIRFENFAEHAIGSAGDPTSSESGEVFPIIPWLLTRGNWCNNLSVPDGNGQTTYFVAVNGDNEIISPYRTPCALADAASSDMNVSCWSKSFAIMEDKTINSLYKGATNKDFYNDMGEGRTLTITSGGVILSRYGSIGSEATCGGAAGHLNFPNRAYITMVFKESGDTKRGIWAPMTSPNGCSYGNLTTLDTYLGGDQTGIDGDLTVNYGSLVLGTAETPAQLDCTVNLVGKKTKLTVVSPENFDPYASDINFVDIIGENAVVQMDSDAVIRKLQIDGVSLPRGQYSAENLPSRITGGGVLTVRLDDEKRGSMLLLK